MSLVIGRDDLSKQDRELYKYGRHLCTSSVEQDKTLKTLYIYEI